MTRGITIYELSPSLRKLIEEGNGGGGTGPTPEPSGRGIQVKKNTTVINTTVTKVDIGIPEFNKTKDLLLVMKNSTYIEEGTHYTISNDGHILALSGQSWNTERIPMAFNFIVFTEKINSVTGEVNIIKSTKSITTPATSVEIGIEGFNKELDSIMVFKNSTYLEHDEDYTISNDNLSILPRVGDKWNLNSKNITFNFMVIKKSQSSGVDSSIINEIKNDVTNLKNNKVDKVLGKGLSTNDYTSVDKTAVSTISNKADTSTVTNISNKLNTVETSWNGFKTGGGEINGGIITKDYVGAKNTRSNVEAQLCSGDDGTVSIRGMNTDGTPSTAKIDLTRDKGVVIPDNIVISNGTEFKTISVERMVNNKKCKFNQGVASDSSAILQIEIDGVIKSAYHFGETECFPNISNKISLGKSANVFTDLYLSGTSKSNNGYTKLPNGMILQWGAIELTDPVVNAYHTIDFPITFPTKVFRFSHTKEAMDINFNPRSMGSVARFEHLTNSSQQIRIGEFNSNTKYIRIVWFAIGH